MSKPVLKTALLINFRQTVRELGADPDALVEKAGLSPQVLDNPELVIPTNAFRRLVNLAAHETGCPYLGLLLAKDLDLSILGPVGLLLHHSDSVKDALNKLVQYVPTRFQGQNVVLEVDGELAALCSHLQAGEEDYTQSVMLTGTMAVKVMRFLCGEAWQPVEIHLTLDRPPFADIVSRHFKAPVRFGRESMRVFFNASDLHKPIPAKYGKFGQYLKPLMAQMDTLPEDIVGHTQYLIRMLLPEGQCSIQNITGLMHTSERSLQRHLKNRGTSFRKLVDKTRISIAQQQLNHSDLSHSQLAYMLGYTELSAFTRAFKRWFGVAPSKWKTG